MGKIYSDAFVNISAGNAADAEAGFLKPRNPLQIRSCRHPTILAIDGVADRQPRIICPAVPRPDRILNKDVLNSRGWILQERALSRRIIHFGPHEVYWECLVHSATEREPEDFRASTDSILDRQSQTRRQSWLAIRSGLHYIQNPSATALLRVLGDNWIEESRSQEQQAKWILRNLGRQPKIVGRYTRELDDYRLLTVPSANSPEENLRLATYHLWYMLVEDYCLRSLTQVTDRLTALSGIAQIFQRFLGEDERYMAGMWMGDVINGLCWYRQTQNQDDDHVPSPPTADSRETTYVAPSFSWASSEAPICFAPSRGNELPLGMTMASQFEIEILDFKVDLAGLDAFGWVSGGYMKMQTYVISCAKLLKLHPNSAPIYDNPLDTKLLSITGSTLLCLVVRSRVMLSNNPSHINGELKDCLIVMPVDNDLTPSDSSANGKHVQRDRYYRRIGFVSAHTPMERTGPLACPDCDHCRSGAAAYLEEKFAQLFAPKTEDEAAREKEKKERENRAIGYGEWQEMELTLV